MTKTDEKNRAMRRERLVREIRALAKREDSAASKLAASKIEAVAEGMSRSLAQEYDGSDLEQALITLVEQYPSVRLAADNSPEDRAELEAARIAAGPTLDEIKAMPSAAARLEAINELEAKKREEAARESAKLDSPGDNSRLQHMSGAQKLALANDLKRFGVKPEPKAPSPEQLRKMDAARRLDAVNRQIESSRKNASALAKRLNATRKDSASG